MARVYIAADHGGFALKQKLIPYIKHLGYDVEDCGAFALNMQDDYPVFIQSAAKKLSADIAAGNKENRAVVIGGSGQGEAFAANRIKRIRAVVYYGEPARMQIDADGRALDIISSTREHNNSNILSLAGRFLTEGEAQDAVKRWLAAPFDGTERHERRHRMLDENA